MKAGLNGASHPLHVIVTSSQKQIPKRAPDDFLAVYSESAQIIINRIIYGSFVPLSQHEEINA
jgi:hypothetical protein